MPFSKINEIFLHYLWQAQYLSKQTLVTLNGDNIIVEFPGWYNLSKGPDFKNARLSIGEHHYYGDIEFHLEENAWYTHQHHLDESYNRVILHVFLHSAKQRVKNLSGLEIPSLQLSLIAELKEQILSFNSRKSLIAPGACGLFLKQKQNFTDLKKILFKAAEQRILNHTKKIQTQIESLSSTDTEDFLYALILKSLGLNEWSHNFYEMAHYYPYSHLQKILRLNLYTARQELLSRWFGWLDLFQPDNAKFLPQDLQSEWPLWQERWLTLQHSTGENLNRKKSRPHNHPVKRLLGFYEHLIQTYATGGLLKSWLNFFYNLQKHPLSAKRMLTNYAALFPTSQSNKMIGQQKQIIIFINGILPFFLAWSKIHKQSDLEKTLFHCFLLFPSEGENAKIKFMKNRLFIDSPLSQEWNKLFLGQGFIELYHQCCNNYYQGCQNCLLLKLLTQISSSLNMKV